MGKDVPTANLESFTVRRPRAVIKRFGLSKEEAQLLSTKFLPSFNSLVILNQKFSKYQSFRSQLMCYLINKLESEIIPGIGAMFITVKLMAGARLTHLDIVEKGLNMYPEIISIPELKPSLIHYMTSMDHLNLLVCMSVVAPIYPTLPKYFSYEGKYTSLVNRVKEGIVHKLFASDVSVEAMAKKLNLPFKPPPIPPIDISKFPPI